MTLHHTTTTTLDVVEPLPTPSPADVTVRSSLIIGNSNISSYPRGPPPPQPTWITRAVMRTARARWFIFLRRVFHYQNGSSPNSSNNPLNSGRWMGMELACLMVQISLTCITLLLSQDEKPIWPMRMWVVGYDFGCFISLLMLYCRYRTYGSHHHESRGRGRGSEAGEENRVRSTTLGRVKSSLDLFYAMWFVMGNVWAFDARPINSYTTFHRAPKLHALCVVLLAWNAVCYAFPFFLFLLLCVFLPLISGVTGYNLNTLLGSGRGGSKGASDEEIEGLVSWTFKEDLESNGADDRSIVTECCICLAKYRNKEEIRELPCHHVFHQKCVDQWLRIISCCPLCKQPITN